MTASNDPRFDPANFGVFKTVRPEDLTFQESEFVRNIWITAGREGRADSLANFAQQMIDVIDGKTYAVDPVIWRMNDETIKLEIFDELATEYRLDELLS